MTIANGRRRGTCPQQPSDRSLWRAHRELGDRRRQIRSGEALGQLRDDLGGYPFTRRNLVVGFYLGRATVAQTYGAAGSGVVVLLWLYFSAQMFLFGAEFTQVYARRYGRGLNPREQREMENAPRAVTPGDARSARTRCETR